MVSRSLFIKYRQAIDKYSHQRAVRLSKNREFACIFESIKNNPDFWDFARVDETLKDNVSGYLKSLTYLINLK